MSTQLYAERDIMELDRLGDYFIRHMMAMTAEGLHSKSDIAAELGHRDAEIARAYALIEEMREVVERYAARGSGSLDRDEYYCPICEAHHANCSLIKHEEYCWLSALITKADAFLKERGQ